MDASHINSLIREWTGKWEEHHPGSRAHGERVAVYSVSTAHQLGFAPELLLKIRVLSELGKIPNAVEEVDPDAIRSTECLEVVALCREFDRRRSGYGTSSSMTDMEVVAWLDVEARRFHSKEMVDALLSVQGIIQPIGT